MHTNHVQDSKARKEKVGSLSMYVGGNPAGAAATSFFWTRIERIKRSILNNSWHLNVFLSGRVYLKFTDEANGKSLGFSSPFKESDLDQVYNEIEIAFFDLDC